MMADKTIKLVFVRNGEQEPVKLKADSVADGKLYNSGSAPRTLVVKLDGEVVGRFTGQAIDYWWEDIASHAAPVLA